MKVLIACEWSGAIKNAMLAAGIDCWSCDIKPSSNPYQHIQADAAEVIKDRWDMVIAHPPCTYISYAGARWFKKYPERAALRDQALDFAESMYHANAHYVAVENPKGWLQERLGKPHMAVHPYYFGDGYTKETWFWVRNLPPLLATNVVSNPVVNWTSHNRFGHDRQTARSITPAGLADAIVQQWGLYAAREIENEQRVRLSL